MRSGQSATPGPDGGVASGDTCPFCHIAACYPPYNPLRPPQPAPPPSSSSSPISSPSFLLSPDRTLPGPATFILLSTPLLIAFLDIMPLSRGHVLLCPRAHRPKLTAASPAEARELGFFVRVLSEAVARATGVEDWNVVQNNGAAAAQVVPHTHFHIIPRPEIREQGRWSDKFTMFGRGTRSDLDDEEGAELAARIRRFVAEVLGEEEDRGTARVKVKL